MLSLFFVALCVVIVFACSINVAVCLGLVLFVYFGLLSFVFVCVFCVVVFGVGVCLVCCCFAFCFV